MKKLATKCLFSSLALSIALAVGSPFAMANQPAATPSATELAAARYDSANDIFHPVYAKQGMVASEQGLATQVGADILRQGGNAVDAAVAVGFALAVVLPNAGNIGGGGFMVLHDAKSGGNYSVDFRETAPLKADRDMYLDKDGNVIDGRSLYTHFAVGVPGTVAGMEYALKKWGTMSLAQVIAPAIKLAEKGFVVGPMLASTLKEEKDNLGKWPQSKAIFFKHGEPLQEGDLLVQKDLANSLKLIAKQGAKAFYEGDIAKKIVAEMEKNQGLITLEDLKGYKVVERKPIEGEYRGYKVVTMPPPSSGGVHLVQILNILERYPMADYGVNSAKMNHPFSGSFQSCLRVPSEIFSLPVFCKNSGNRLNLEKIR